eukprot:TRINITY_DN8694_c0_g10_i1.p1 TRINITY_DN8694_c0_g10~~TRINITY_DN8694_c0_g10_i1.p1  ORF type:complete len:335 (-),score=34.89 TRINITY_DN8694_c0_g10_i1:114-1118(-)
MRLFSLYDETTYLIIMILAWLFHVVLEGILGLRFRDIHVLGDAFHGFLHILALAFSLYARLKPTFLNSESLFTYGTFRLETLAAFSNVIFLFFVNLFLFFRSIHSNIEQLFEESGTTESQVEAIANKILLGVCVFRIILDGIGIFLFRKYKSIKTKSDEVSKTSCFGAATDCIATTLLGYASDDTFSFNSKSENLHAVFLHFYLDLLAALSVLAAAYFPFELWLLHSEVILALLLLFITISVSKELFLETGTILLQGAPKSINIDKIHSEINEISYIEGVLAIADTKVWALYSSFAVCYLKLKLRNEEDARRVKPHATEKLKSVCQQVFIECEI